MTALLLLAFTSSAMSSRVATVNDNGQLEGKHALDVATVGIEQAHEETNNLGVCLFTQTRSSDSP
jgi:hypothetical protein